MSNQLKRPIRAPIGLFSFSLFAAFGFVVWLAFPIFWNSLIAQRSIDTIAALKRGDEVSEVRLRATMEAIASTGPSDRATGDRLVDQGTLTLALALQLPGSDPEHIELLQQATELAEARVQEAPADTHTWARLAYAEYYLNGPSTVAFEALRMSHLTGPYEYYLLWSRLRLGVFLWNFLDEELKEMTVVQAAMIWHDQRDRRQLVQYFFQMPNDPQTRLMERLQDRDDFETFQTMIEQAAQSQGN